MNHNLEDYIAYGLKALQDRRAYLVDAQQKTTNPLEKLSLSDRINELDICVNYFKDASNFKSKAELEIPEPPEF